MNSFAYNCCFCGKSGVVRYEEPEFLTAQLKTLLSVMPKSIACDPCASAERKRRDLRAAIRNRAQKWDTRTDEEQKLLWPIAKKKFEILIRRLCQATSDRYKVFLNYDEAMVEPLLVNPQSVETVLGAIERCAKQASAERKA